MKIAMVTGASSGIGEEFVKQIDRLFQRTIDELWLIARNKEKLEQVAARCKCKTRILALDVTKDEDIQHIEKLLSIGNPEIVMCVLSAGYGLEGRFEELPISEQLGMIDCNCKALTHLSYSVLPYMKANDRLILMASSAAFMPQSGFAIYAATKSYVLSFGRALNNELTDRGITVTSVCPGPVNTPFFDVAEKYAKGKNFKKFTMVNPGLVVRCALADSKDHRDMSVPGFWMKLFYPISRFLPHRFLLRFTA